LDATLILVDRPTGRAAAVALAGAVEASAIASRVALELANGTAAVAVAARRAIDAGRRAVVGWSFLSAEAEAVARDLAMVRAALPDGTSEPVLHVAGGAHATAEPERTLATGFDLVARGEGEATIVALLTRLVAGEDPRGAPGLAWREGEGVRTSGRAEPVDIDAHPPFARSLGKAAALEVTRGCVWACAFCQTPFLYRARFRHRSVASARAWARFACRELGFRDLRFLTPSAFSYGASGSEVRLDAVEALLAAVREEAGTSRRIFFGTFPSELRPEHVSQEALAVVRRYADNTDLLIGGQSGSDRLLAAMARGHDVEAVERAICLAREAGFRPSVDVIVGLPGEREEDLAATRALMQRLAGLGARIHAHAFMPLPGTPWRAEAPGRYDAETTALLDRLASDGLAYGHWRRQERVGAELARASAAARGS
jgi:B12-binding domain/radical SAM domain protein